MIKVDQINSATDLTSNSDEFVPTVKAVKTYVDANSGGVGPGTTNEIAYFDSTNTIASLPVSTYPNLTELSYIKGLRARPSRTLFYINNTASSLTGTTSETILDSFLIPGGTLSANDILSFRLVLTKSGTVGTCTIRINFNTSNTLVGDTTIATGLIGSSAVYIGLERNFYITNNISDQFTFNNTSAQTTELLSVTVAYSTYNFDFTIDNYVTISAANSSSLDTTTIRSFTSEIIRK